jgi:hypothetical protein
MIVRPPDDLVGVDEQGIDMVVRPVDEMSEGAEKPKEPEEGKPDSDTMKREISDPIQYPERIVNKYIPDTDALRKRLNAFKPVELNVRERDLIISKLEILRKGIKDRKLSYAQMMEVSEKITGLKREDYERGKKSGKFMLALLRKLHPDSQDSVEMRKIAVPVYKTIQGLANEIKIRLVPVKREKAATAAKAAPETRDTT